VFVFLVDKKGYAGVFDLAKKELMGKFNGWNNV